jgi:hypothetical protein
MIALKQSSAIRRAHLPDLLAKKSRSTVNCPIWGIFTATSDRCRQTYYMAAQAPPLLCRGLPEIAC